MENNHIPPTPVLIEDLGRIKLTESSNYTKKCGIYKCSCGNEFRAVSSSINTKQIKSCGCFREAQRLKSITKHGMSTHRLYTTWNNMMSRCNNEKDKDYVNYGLRGIRICDKWMDFKNFVDDMYSSFEVGLTLDRIDVNGNYEHSNCRWATKTVQARNTRVLSNKNKTGYRGVSYDNRSEKFRAFIGIGMRLKALGSFDTAIDAAIAYDLYIIENKLEHTTNGVVVT